VQYETFCGKWDACPAVLRGERFGFIGVPTALASPGGLGYWSVCLTTSRQVMLIDGVLALAALAVPAQYAAVQGLPSCHARSPCTGPLRPFESLRRPDLRA
jgi:hypothetical protein